MSKRINICICFIFLLFKVGYSQDRTKVTEVETHTYVLEKEGLKTGFIDKPKILIKGRVHENPNYDNFIPYATVIIKGTKLYSKSDSLGFYSIDITSIADTANSITLVCYYIAHEKKEIILSHKVLSTTTIDVKLIAQPACNYPEVELKPKHKNKSKH